jgi:xanthine dehydrogenase YagT iron-sulfur-binding subunit
MDRDVTLSINGSSYDVRVDIRTTLLDALRERLGMPGAKKGCDHGQCGACTVLLDGRRVNSCLLLAVAAEDAAVTTIEGLTGAGADAGADAASDRQHADREVDADGLHPLQRAFVDHDAFQCGYCTPGQICSTLGMLAEAADGAPSFVTADLTAPIDLDDEEIRERMSGNLCRCAAYMNIVPAIVEYARREGAL